MVFRLLILFLLAGFNLHAQEKSFSFAISGGAGIPTSHFRSGEVHAVWLSQVVVSPGYARTGWNADLSFAYKPLTFFASFAALIRNQDNSLNTGALGDNHGDKLVTRANHWNTTSFLFGLSSHGINQYNQRVKFYIKLLFGPAYCQLPSVTVEGMINNKPYFYHQSGQTVFSASYLIGGGMRIPVGKRIGVLINLDYFLTRAEFKAVRVTNSNGSLTTSQTIKQNITVISIGAGLAFRI